MSFECKAGASENIRVSLNGLGIVYCGYAYLYTVFVLIYAMHHLAELPGSFELLDSYSAARQSLAGTYREGMNCQDSLSRSTGRSPTGVA